MRGVEDMTVIRNPEALPKLCDSLIVQVTSLQESANEIHNTSAAMELSSAVDCILQAKTHFLAQKFRALLDSKPVREGGEG